MWGQGIDVDQYEVAKGLIQFNNMFGNGPGQIPYGSVIEHVTLEMYNSGANDDSGGDVATIHELYQSWNPTTVTWDNFSGGNPSMNSTSDGTIGVNNNSLLGTPCSTANDGNLINTVQAWADGAANDGWILQQEGRDDFTGDGNGLWLAGTNSASDAAQRPMLLVDDAPPPTITSFTTNTTPEADGKSHVKQGSPLVVSLGASDAWAGDDITYSVNGAALGTSGSGDANHSHLQHPRRLHHHRFDYRQQQLQPQRSRADLVVDAVADRAGRQVERQRRRRPAGDQFGHLLRSGRHGLDCCSASVARSPRTPEARAGGAGGTRPRAFRSRRP